MPEIDVANQAAEFLRDLVPYLRVVPRSSFRRTVNSLNFPSYQYHLVYELMIRFEYRTFDAAWDIKGRGKCVRYMIPTFHLAFMALALPQRSYSNEKC